MGGGCGCVDGERGVGDEDACDCGTCGCGGGADGEPGSGDPRPADVGGELLPRLGAFPLETSVESVGYFSIIGLPCALNGRGGRSTCGTGRLTGGVSDSEFPTFMGSKSSCSGSSDADVGLFGSPAPSAGD